MIPANTMDLILSELDKVHEQSALRPATGPLPDRNAIVAIVRDVQALLFPGYYAGSEKSGAQALLASISFRLEAQLDAVYRFLGISAEHIDGLVCRFLAELPRIKEMLCKDVEALYEGDPAARCREEVLLCYPGFNAIAIYRIAHVLYQLEVPILPRIMTEYAHAQTGIDIHAGATIGEYFFIDHGTGIVIGETTVIGNHVKLYQGVTLGAKSFELDEDGNPVKGIKRHPNIGDHVIIYANATILGGRTTVGDGCVIGGNTWLVHSVPPGQTVYYTNKSETAPIE